MLVLFRNSSRCLLICLLDGFDIGPMLHHRKLHQLYHTAEDVITFLSLRSCVPGHRQGATNDPDHGSFLGSAWPGVQGNRAAERETTPRSGHEIKKYPCWFQDCGMLSGGVASELPTQSALRAHCTYCKYCPFATSMPSRPTDWVGFCALATTGTFWDPDLSRLHTNIIYIYIYTWFNIHAHVCILERERESCFNERVFGQRVSQASGQQCGHPMPERSGDRCEKQKRLGEGRDHSSQCTHYGYWLQLCVYFYRKCSLSKCMFIYIYKHT